MNLLMKLSDKETKVIVQIANQKLSASNPGHNKIHSIWNDERYEGWVVHLEDCGGNLITPAVVVLNSEIESGIQFLNKLEHVKQNDPIVEAAFAMSPSDELHALRLAVVGLVKSIEILTGYP